LGPSVFAAQTSPAETVESAPIVTEPKKVTGYRVQLGAFIDQKLAASLAERAKTDLGSPTYVVFDRPFYRVRAGDFRDLSDAEALKSVAIGKGYQDARIAREEIMISD
jgi:cell division septation protein DedD